MVSPLQSTTFLAQDQVVFSEEGDFVDFISLQADVFIPSDVEEALFLISGTCAVGLLLSQNAKSRHYLHRPGYIPGYLLSSGSVERS